MDSGGLVEGMVVSWLIAACPIQDGVNRDCTFGRRRVGGWAPEIIGEGRIVLACHLAVRYIT